MAAWQEQYLISNVVTEFNRQMGYSFKASDFTFRCIPVNQNADFAFEAVHVGSTFTLVLRTYGQFGIHTGFDKWELDLMTNNPKADTYLLYEIEAFFSKIALMGDEPTYPCEFAKAVASIDLETGAAILSQTGDPLILEAA